MIEDLKGEIWKQYRDTPYFASTYGRVKRIYKNGKERLLNSWVKKNRSGSCYMLIKIHCKETKVSYVVWEAFNGLVPDGHAVTHRNKCYGDNALVNLKIVTRNELGELYGGRTSIRRLIYCYDNNRIYKGTREAANDLHISRQTVSDYCDRKIQKPMFRLRWMREGE